MDSINDPEKEQLVKNISELQAKYYETNKKNNFFKSGQKTECAKQVIQNMDIEKLIQHSFFLIPNTNNIFFDYPLFKTYACAEVYEQFATHSYSVLYSCLAVNATFEMHVNMNSFTISAFERLRKLIERFFIESPLFSDKLTYVYVYYTPSIIDHINTIIKMFISHISYKIVYFSKTESENKMSMLFSRDYKGHDK